MPEELDHVARYAAQIGFQIRPKTILVEGTSDADLFGLAARLVRKKTGANLLGTDLAIVAAGLGDNGGTRGVVRELIALRGLARTCLLQNGNPKYRFVGMFDDDRAGREAVKLAHYLDGAVLEYKDIFRIRPMMCRAGNRDPGTVQAAFERENATFRGLDWELEDLLPQSFIESFCDEFPNARLRLVPMSGRVHHEFTRDGKSRLSRYVKENAILEDMQGVVQALVTMRHYLLLPTLDL